MKTTKKLNVMIAVLMVLSLLLGNALAEEKLYTSDPFKIPADRVEGAGELPEETGSETETEPEGEALPGEAAPGDVTEKPTVEGEPVPEGTVVPEGAEVPEGTVVPEGTEVPEGGEETPTEGEEGLTGEEIPTEGEEGTTGEDETEPGEEPLPTEERKVTITTSRGDYVTDGEPIYLESHLEGFGGLTVHYQWQVDKNDGEGWQDVGADRDYHVFVATRESVMYSWRLIVTVEE